MSIVRTAAIWIVLLLGHLLTTPAGAQHGAPPVKTAASSTAPEAAQFDFLLGEWEIELQRKVGGLAAMLHGTPRLLGTWKAERVLDGRAVQDTLRLFDDNGNPVGLTQHTRFYDPRSGQWKVSALDALRGLFSAASGRRDAGTGELRLEGHGQSGDGRPFASRTRFTAISADGFTMLQDRSYDSGESWEEAAITIVAKRRSAAE